MYKIGIDVGGTFTDFVVAGEGGQPPGQTHSKLRVLIESRDEARDRFRL